MNQKLKILHLEDSAFDADLIHRELKKGGVEFDVLLVEKEQDFIDGLKNFLPDIILSDHSLPQFSSLAALKIVRELQVRVPFILISAATSEENAVTIMREGAWDFILKDRLQRLPTAVRLAIEKYNSELAKSKAELRLTEAHRKLLFHIENSPFGFIEWDDQLRIKSWSKRAEEIFGWNEEEVLEADSTGGPDFLRHLTWISEIAKDLLEKDMERKQMVNCVVTKDGTEIWCEWHISIQKDDQGATTTIMALVSDITERKKEQEHLERLVSDRTRDLKAVNDHLEISNQELLAANAELKEFETQLKRTSEEFKDLYNNSPCGYLSLDAEGFFVEANDTLLGWLGYKREELVNALHIKDVLTEAGKADFHKRFPAFKQHGHMVDVKSNFIRRDGSILSTIVNSSAVLDDHGNFLKSRTSVFDLSRIKQIERELKIAKSAAEAANETKSQFLANMSHEIRTPLNAVLGLTHLALKTELTPKQADYLKKIYSSSDSLLSIINDILDFSKIESGKLKLEEVTFDLEDVFQKLSDVITYKAESKGLEIVFGIDSKVPKYLIGDPVSLGQILSNLLSNAVKFTDRGEVVVNVNIVETTGDKIKLQFAVTDTGIGMDQAQISRLFVPFTQADNSISRKYGGTGLGLSIMKRLVELMDGEVSVESTPGEGSEFCFTAWLKIQKQQRKLPAPSLDLRKLNVMVVDDNKSSLRILKEMLESFSFNVIAMDSALKAVHYLKNNFHIHPVQLVLMDAKIPPGMDGLEAVSILRSDAELSGIRVIMMCYNNRYESLYQKAEELGLSGILVKPVRYSEAYDSIINAIQNDSRMGAHSMQVVVKDTSNQRSHYGHLLLVEDNEINQQVATELLMGFGFTVDVAGNGLEALTKVGDSIAALKYDLVLMDLQMPVMGGIKATHEIKKNLAFKDLPIIAMTADAIVGVKENCLDAGMVDFISKPINPEQMLNTIEKWLRPRENGTSLSMPRSEKANTNKAIPLIEGIDQEDGLHHLGGNSRLYYELLVKFLQGHKTFLNELAEKLNRDEREEARRMIHTLKGMSGNLGMIDLHKNCFIAEALLSEKVLSTEAVLATVAGEMNRVLDGLDKNLMTETVSPEVTRELMEIKPLLSQLASLLKENDPEAANILKQIGIIKGYEDQMREVENSLRRYDFDKAQTIFKEIESQL